MKTILLSVAVVAGLGGVAEAEKRPGPISRWIRGLFEKPQANKPFVPVKPAKLMVDPLVQDLGRIRPIPKASLNPLTGKRIGTPVEQFLVRPLSPEAAKLIATEHIRPAKSDEQLRKLMFRRSIEFYRELQQRTPLIAPR